MTPTGTSTPAVTSTPAAPSTPAATSTPWWGLPDGDGGWHLHGLGWPRRVPIHAWRRSASASDHALLRHCRDLTLDIGCGPGRLTHALARTGRRALGIDVSEEVVRDARARGALALTRDVFGAVPADGGWPCALLADGNIGIGGDPERLLSRVSALLGPHGRAVVELSRPGSGVRCADVHLQRDGFRSASFPWSEVGAESVGPLARSAGFAVSRVLHHEGRWFAVLWKRRGPRRMLRP